MSSAGGALDHGSLKNGDTFDDVPLEGNSLDSKGVGGTNNGSDSGLASETSASTDHGVSEVSAPDSPTKKASPTKRRSERNGDNHPVQDLAKAEPAAKESSTDGAHATPSSRSRSGTTTTVNSEVTGTPLSQRHRRVSSSSSWVARRSRNNSIALTRGSVDGKELKSAIVIIQSALEQIKNSKDAKRIPVLMQSVTKVLDMFKQEPDVLPAAGLVLEPLGICCAQASSTDVKVTALDCIGKMFSFNYIYNDVEDPSQGSVVKEAIEIVCGAYDAEATYPKVELQIVKALNAALVSDEYAVHGQLLLRVVRHIYNVFVISHTEFNQTAAQVALTQAVQAVFERVKVHVLNQGESGTTSHLSASASSSALPTPAEPVDGNDPVTLEQIIAAGQSASPFDGDASDEGISGTEREELVNDAFLLFRTLCKLADKADIETEVHTQALRSKLFSLHLLHTTLKNNISVFKAPEFNVVFRKKKKDRVIKEYKRFITVIKDQLWNTLAVNATSSSPAIFEVSAEIFWLLFSNLRPEFKPQIQIFLTDVYFTIMDMRTSTMHQKMYFMGLITRICTDPRALVELYLNYDCDPRMPNVFENLIGLIARVDSAPVSDPQKYAKPAHIPKVYKLNSPPAMALQHLQAQHAQNSKSKNADEQNQEMMTLKVFALEALIDTLQSLLLWSQRREQNRPLDSTTELTETQTSTVTEAGEEEQSTADASVADDEHVNSANPDEPTEFEKQKWTKRAIDSAVSDFNYKPDKGIDKLIELGVIKEKDPKEIAEVLYRAEAVDKTKLGDFLGGSDELSQQTLHHFIYLMNMARMSFVDALRMTLQAFRLPGEGQMIDRFMLQFASKYHTDNPTVFANAELAYCLSYSAMMLNTELHSSNLRRARMTFEDFAKNNRGLNDGFDFPEEFLREIYDEIGQHEIKLVSEQQERIIKEESYDAASAVISGKAFELFRMINPDDEANGDYFNASHVEHVRPMFEVAWMSILAGLSAPYQQFIRSATLSYEFTKMCLDGMALALRIACHFDVDLARVSFFQTLTRFANLTQATSLQQRNLDIVIAMFKVALKEGDMLKESWYDILVIASQVDRLHSIAQGVVPSDIPDVLAETDNSVGDLQPDVVAALTSREFGVLSDKVFAQSANLNASAIVSFIKALAKVSLREIEVSRDSAELRTFSLKKMVEVCYYNMSRIRMEWSQVWQAIAEYFNAMVSDKRRQVAELALDSLRQLSLRFLEIEELPHFLFQRDFLAPYEYAIKLNPDTSVKVFAIECLKVMIAAKADKLESGWAAIFNAVKLAAECPETPVLNAAYQLVALVHTSDSADALPTGYLDALCALAEQADARVALRAVELMKQLFESHPDDLKLWHELFGKLSRIAMRGKDLEVRGRCLTTLFAVLTEQGGKFDRSDWDTIFDESLLPLFSILRSGATSNSSSSRSSGSNSTEDMSFWLSSTLIQALRSLVGLVANYFDMLEHALKPFFLGLLKTCITQDNDPVSRMGNTCLQELVKDNVEKFNDEHWHQIAGTIVVLFQDTTPTGLRGRGALDDPRYNNVEGFRSVVALVIQNLKVMDTVYELLVKTPAVLEHMPVSDILRISSQLLSTFNFARDFNHDYELRTQLYQRGIVRQTPNMLKEESTAAQTYISLSMRLFRSKDRFGTDPTARGDIAEELIPMCRTVLHDYNNVPGDHRYVKTLTPIVESILRHICKFDDEDFATYVRALYLDVIEILNKDMPKELREAVQAILRRIADVHMNGTKPNEVKQN